MAEEFKVLIGGDITGLNRALNSATVKLNSFETKVNKIADVGKKLSGLGRQLTAGLTLPIVGVGAAAVKAYGDIEALKLGLEAVAGSSEKAEAQFIRLKEVAKLPGLGLEEAVKGAINLQAIGIEARKAENILMQFGNAVATVGKGRAEFERAIYGVQQLANTEFPLGEDLNIIKDALPQVNTLLKEAFGSARSDELAKMGVTSKQIVETITQGLSELPRVTGGVKGAFENLQDSLKISLSRIGNIINKNLDISGIVDKITTKIDKLVTAFEGLSPTMQKIILGIAGVTAVVGPLLLAIGGFLAAIPSIISGITAIGTAFGIATTVATGGLNLVIAGVVAIGVVIASNWDKIKPYFIKFVNYWRKLYNESIVFRTAVQAIGFVFKGMYDIAKGVLVGVWDLIKSLGRSAVSVFSSIGDVFKGALTFDYSLIKTGIKGVMSASVGTVVDATKSIANSFSETKDAINQSLEDIKVDKLELIKDIPSNLNIKIPDLKNQEDNIVNNVTDTIDNIKDRIERSIKVIPIKIPLSVSIEQAFGERIENSFKSTFERISQSIKDNVDLAVRPMVDALTDAQVKTIELFNNINEGFKDAVGNNLAEGITNVFEGIGNAIANGGSVLSAIGSGLVNMFSSFLSDMGGMLVKYGTIAVLKGKLDNAIAIGGSASIVAGLAAIGVGALLSVAGSALGSRAKGGFSGGSYGGYTGYTGYSAPTSTTPRPDSYQPQEVKFRIEGRELVGVMNNTNQRNNRING